VARGVEVRSDGGAVPGGSVCVCVYTWSGNGGRKKNAIALAREGRKKGFRANGGWRGQDGTGVVREKPAAEKGHGKPQKLITDINTLTPWTLLLMYFLPFRPTGAHQHLSLSCATDDDDGSENQRERVRAKNFRRKNPPSTLSLPLFLVIYIYI